MAQNLYLVFSQKPAEVSAEEYDRWYAHHAQENIESPGFVSAQRYVVRGIDRSAPNGVEQHLALYEYKGDMSGWRTDLTRRLSTGEILLPDWFDKIAFTSWDCQPVGNRLTPRG
jgi:hypothetical protein